MKVVEMFSGIGSQARALENIAKRRNTKIEIVKTCEWNYHAFIAYDLIHNHKNIDTKVNQMNKLELLEKIAQFGVSSNGKEPSNLKQLSKLNEELLKQIYASILNNNNLVNILDVKGDDLPNDVDLLTYSFPCQDLSNVGSFHGYKNGIDRDKNTRSGLLWEIERILGEKKSKNENLPTFLLLENVTALEAKRHKVNFDQWREKLESYGYINKTYILNSLNFGIPQNRKRLIMLSVLCKDPQKKELIEKYLSDNNLNDANYVATKIQEEFRLSSFLKLDYTIDKYYNEALEAQPNKTPSRLKIWDNNYKIVDEEGNISEKVQTITTKQDRHPNSGNIFFQGDKTKSPYRFLTPRECFLLMGFKEEDFEILINNNFNTVGNSLLFSRDVLYKLSGNSIVINVLEYVFDQMFDIYEVIHS